MWLGENGIKPCRLSLPFPLLDGKEVSDQTDADDDDDDVYSFLLVPHPHPIPARSIPPTPTPSFYQQQSIC